MNMLFILVSLLGTLVESSALNAFKQSKIESCTKQQSMSLLDQGRIAHCERMARTTDLEGRTLALNVALDNKEVALTFNPTSATHTCGCNESACGSSNYPWTSGALAEDTTCTLFGNVITFTGYKSTLERKCPAHGRVIVERFIEHDCCRFVVRIKDAPGALNVAIKDGKLCIDAVVKKDGVNKQESLVTEAARYITKGHVATPPQLKEGEQKHEQAQQDNKSLLHEARSYFSEDQSTQESESETGPKRFVLEISLPQEKRFLLKDLEAVLKQDSLSAAPQLVVEDKGVASEITGHSVSGEGNVTQISDQLRSGQGVLVVNKKLALFLKMPKTNSTTATVVQSLK